MMKKLFTGVLLESMIMTAIIATIAIGLLHNILLGWNDRHEVYQKALLLKFMRIMHKANLKDGWVMSDEEIDEFFSKHGPKPL